MRILLAGERIAIDPGGAIRIINWAKYQSEYGRVLKYRRNKKADREQIRTEQNGNGSVTPSGVTSHTQSLTPFPSKGKGSAGYNKSVVRDAPPIESFIPREDEPPGEMPTQELD
jgi:hypothetical protein